MLIFKICHKAEWTQAERDGLYAGSTKDQEDHFMHFSTAEQVRGTLERYYADANDLVLVAVTADTLGPALKYEPSRDGALFPHLYGTLPVTLANWVKPIRRAADGTFLLPKEIP